MPLEIITGVVIGAAATSQNVRKAIRKGMIYGVGSVLVAYDKVSAMAHGVVDGARKGFAKEADAGDATTPGAAAVPANGQKQEAAPVRLASSD